MRLPCQSKRLRYVTHKSLTASQRNALKLADEVSFLKMEAIGDDGTIDLSEVRPKSEVETGFSLFFDGDVVIAKITPCFENGKGALIRGLRNGVGFGTTELLVLTPLNNLDGQFLYWITMSSVFRKQGEGKIEAVAADLGTMKVAYQGDIVFNKMRMWQGAVGVSPCDGLTSPDYVVAHPVSDDLNIEYAKALFRTPLFSAECARHSNGITWDRLRLYWEGFRDIWIPLPPLTEQKAIVAHLQRETAKLDALAASAAHTITLLKERRAALISAAVTGQIQIREST